MPLRALHMLQFRLKSLMRKRSTPLSSAHAPLQILERAHMRIVRKVKGIGIIGVSLSAKSFVNYCAQFRLSVASLRDLNLKPLLYGWTVRIARVNIRSLIWIYSNA